MPHVHHHLEILQNLVPIIHTTLHETLLFRNAALYERHEAQPLSVQRQRPNLELLLKVQALLRVRERDVRGAGRFAVLDVQPGARRRAQRAHEV